MNLLSGAWQTTDTSFCNIWRMISPFAKLLGACIYFFNHPTTRYLKKIPAHNAIIQSSNVCVRMWVGGLFFNTQSARLCVCVCLCACVCVVLKMKFPDLGGKRKCISTCYLNKLFLFMANWFCMMWFGAVNTRIFCVCVQQEAYLFGECEQVISHRQAFIFRKVGQKWLPLIHVRMPFHSFRSMSPYCTTRETTKKV